MGRKKDGAEQGTGYAEQYKKNEYYSQDEITNLIKIYHMALDAGDNVIIQDVCNRIYAMTEKFVYKTLWTNYKTLMKNPCHRDDITQEIWVKVFGELKNYDPEKGSITTFIIPWIRHVISDYTSKNFRKTTVYYANTMTKISGAQNYAKQFGLDPDDIETIMSLTGLSRATIRNTLDLMTKKDMVSYEALTESGVDYRSSIKGPEETVIEVESEKALNEILDDILTKEEKQILLMLLSPENPNKKHSSYREIKDQINGSNVPMIKKKISKIITKLKSDRRFVRMYPHIIAREKTLEEAYIPVLDNDEDFSDLEEAYKDFLEGDQ